MAQNAYQFTTSAASLPLARPTTAKKVVFKRATWTRREMLLVTFVSAIVMALMIGVVFTSTQIAAAETNNTQMQTEIETTKESNTTIQSDIQKKTSKSNLEKVAKKYNMTLSDTNVRNVNQ